MKATTGPLPAGDGWVFEPKWDGMRILAAIDAPALDGTGRAGITLTTANGHDATVRFPELAPLASALGTAAVLDGEVVVLESDRPSFERLQRRIHVTDAAEAGRRAADSAVTYVVFDLVHLDGHDLVDLPWDRRRRLLEQLIDPGPHWVVSTVSDDGSALFEAARRSGMEGVVAKRVDSSYEQGRRSAAWRKVKVRRRQEMVVGGWTPGAGTRSGQLGSLLVGHHDDGRLRFAGRVGSGFDDTELTRLGALLAERGRDRCPFDPPPPHATARQARWVEPDLVVEVEFAEWTAEGRLRHPVYLGQRVDRDPAAVVREPDRPGDQ